MDRRIRTVARAQLPKRAGHNISDGVPLNRKQRRAGFVQEAIVLPPVPEPEHQHLVQPVLVLPRDELDEASMLHHILASKALGLDILIIPAGMDPATLNDAPATNYKVNLEGYIKKGTV